MRKLDENGRLVLAGAELTAGRNTRALERDFTARYQTVDAAETNLAMRRLAFGYAVLSNSDAPTQAEDYLTLRPKLPQLLEQRGFSISGWLVLDEGAGHAAYAAQKKDTAGNGAFGRIPVVVWMEHTTGTVLVEGAAGLSEQGELL